MLSPQTRISRRQILFLGTGIATAGALAACAPASSTPTAPTLASATQPTAAPTTASPAAASTAAPTAVVSTGTHKTTKVDFWNWWGVQRKPLLDKILSQVTKENPWVTIDSVVQPWDRRDEKVATAMASGHPPQVIMATRQELVRFAAAAQIISIDPYVKERGVDVAKRFYPSEIESLYWKGKLYSMPMPTAGGESSLMWVSDQLLSQAHLDPAKPPATWADLESAAKSMLKKNAMGAIEVLGADVGSSDADFTYWLYTNAGSFLSDDMKKITFNAPEGVATLEWMVKFTKEVNGGIENVKDFWQSATGESNQYPFYQNRLGLWLTNVSAFFLTKQNAPAMAWHLGLRPYNATNAKAASHGVAGYSFGWSYPIPKGFDDDTNLGAYLAVEAITVKQGACDFMFDQMRPSPNRTCNDNPEYRKVNPAWDTVLKGLSNDISLKVTPVQSQMATLLKTAVGDAMYGKKAPKDALNGAATQAQKLLDDWWSKQQ